MFYPSQFFAYDFQFQHSNEILKDMKSELKISSNSDQQTNKQITQIKSQIQHCLNKFLKTNSSQAKSTLSLFYIMAWMKICAKLQMQKIKKLILCFSMLQSL